MREDDDQPEPLFSYTDEDLIEELERRHQFYNVLLGDVEHLYDTYRTAPTLFEKELEEFFAEYVKVNR